MKRRHYIFTKRKDSGRAILSTVLGLISLASLGIVLYLSYRKAGDVPLSYGLTGLFAAVFSIAGLVMGGFAIQDKDTFKLFPVLGIALNLLVLGALAFIVQLAF